MSAWHPDDAVLRAYATGTAAFAPAASVEAHLGACAPCRARLRPAVDPGRLDAIFARVGDTIAAEASPPERFLRRLGLAEPTARLVLATPSLRASWVAALGLVMAMLALVAQAGAGDRSLLPFLVVAPLAPVAGVALAYGPAADPAYEVTLAAPHSSFRLLLLRTCAVVATTVPLAAAAALALPGIGGLALGWLLPSLGLTALTLALCSRFDPRAAAAASAGLWVSVVCYARVRHDVLDAFGTTAQAGFACLAVAALLAAVATRHRYGSLGGTA